MFSNSRNFKWAVIWLGISLCSHQAKAQKMFAPVHGYISVETFEIRKEFVMRLDAVGEQLGVDLSDAERIIPTEERVQIEKKLGQYLEGKCPLQVDGQKVEMTLDRVHFVRRDPQLGMVIEDREVIQVGEALLGAVFAAALDGPVKEVTVEWQIFPADGQEAIVSIGTRENTVTDKVSPQAPGLQWLSKGELKIPDLLVMPDVLRNKGRTVPLLSVLCALLVLILLGAAFRMGSKTPAWLGVIVLVVAAIGVLSREQVKIRLTDETIEITPELADEVIYALLRNTYRAFDYRKESDIYDVLAKSVEGELLTEVYLKVRESLELESQGGARARVYELDLKECDLAESDQRSGNGFLARCSWVAIGTVTHWGHTHDRVNRYEANLSVTPVDGAWKLHSLELLNEERLERKR